MKKIVVTGGAGQIAYNLLFRIATGELTGDDPIALHILETPEALPALAGVQMELIDCSFPNVVDIVIGSDPEKIFEDADIVFLIGAKPRGPGMERKDLLKENGEIFVRQGKALNRFASKNAKVLVVGNPCNTNCLIALHRAPNLNPRNFYAMTMLDHLRAQAQLAIKSGLPLKQLKEITIWGNHSTTQVPDISCTQVDERIKHDREWLEDVFIPKVQKRGAAIIQARGKSSAASAAHAALEAMRAALGSTPWFSSGVYSSGNPYGIDENLVFSFPCQSDRGEVSVIPQLSSAEWIEERIRLSEKELIEEREMVSHIL